MLRSWTTSFAFGLALLAAAPIAQAQEETFASKLQPYVDRNELAGAVALAASKEKTLRVEAVGWADVEAKRPMRTDSIVWIASMTKPITGAALMILVDEGKVSLDDPIEKFLPEFKNLWVEAEKDAEHVLLKKPEHKPTVREVMCHCSGMPFKSALETPTLDGNPLRDVVLSYAMTPLVHQPGTKYLYSNCGINTAGRIIEVASGMPYEKFMQTRLFDPLGMTDTGFWLTEEQAARVAECYKPNAAKNGLELNRGPYLKHPYTDRAGRYPMPGGGLFSTAADVAAFGRMVLRGGELDGKRILSEAAVKTMTSKQTPDGVKDGYGVGFTTNGPDQNFGHGGAWATNLNIDVPHQLVTVYLVQHAGFPGEGGKAHGAFKAVAESLYGQEK